MTHYEINPFTKEFDAVRSTDWIDGQWLRLDGGNTMATGIPIVSGDGFVFETVVDTWAFRYKAGLGADNTGIFFNATSGLYEVRYLNATVFSVNVVNGNFTFGNTAMNSDRILTFAAQDSTGTLRWMEDEDYFRFDDDILIPTGENIYFRDTAITLSSLTDGHLDLTADISVDINSPILSTNIIDVSEVATPANPSINKIRIYAIEDDDFSVLETKTNLGITNRIMQDSFRIARNTSGVSIAKGKAVYITGSTGNKPEFSMALASSEATLPAIGLTSAAVADNAFGQVIIVGRISGIKTDYTNAGEPTYAPVGDWAEGDPLYVNATVAGELQNSRPTHPNLEHIHNRRYWGGNQVFKI
jgi:hypothetical protein